MNTRSDQPIITEDKRYYITFNGEIYNYLKLKKKFSKEIRDKIYGDSNLVKEAWKKWGKQCFKMFQGMWAILIYDKKLNEIISEIILELNLYTISMMGQI